MISRDKADLARKVERAGSRLPREANILVDFTRPVFQLDTRFQGAWNKVAAKVLTPDQALVVGLEEGASRAQFGIDGIPGNIPSLEIALINRLLVDRDGVSMRQLRQEGMEDAFNLKNSGQIDSSWRALRARTPQDPDAFVQTEKVGVTAVYRINPLTVVTSVSALQAAKQTSRKTKQAKLIGQSGPKTNESRIELEKPEDAAQFADFSCMEVARISDRGAQREKLVKFLEGDTDVIYIARDAESAKTLRLVIQATSVKDYGDRWTYLQRLYTTVYAPPAGDSEAEPYSVQ